MKRRPCRGSFLSPGRAWGRESQKQSNSYINVMITEARLGIKSGEGLTGGTPGPIHERQEARVMGTARPHNTRLPPGKPGDEPSPPLHELVLGGFSRVCKRFLPNPRNPVNPVGTFRL